MSHIPERMENGIELPDGGYFATLNVYHNLHCIVRLSSMIEAQKWLTWHQKRLHHYMYQDYYFPNITRRQRAANEYHNRQTNYTRFLKSPSDNPHRSLSRHASTECHVPGGHAASDHEMAARFTCSDCQLDSTSSMR